VEGSQPTRKFHSIGAYYKQYRYSGDLLRVPFEEKNFIKTRPLFRYFLKAPVTLLLRKLISYSNTTADITTAVSNFNDKFNIACLKL
jgi:hypothetical protein